MHPLIIVGTGLAGYTLAREWRKLDGESPLMMLSADDGRFYSKPNLSNGYAQNKTADEIAMQSAQQMAEQLKADIRPHTRVEAIDPSAHRATFGNGRQSYRQLVLAVGADPIRVPIEGDGADQVVSINDLADYARFRAAAQKARRIAIMGAGLIGCEFANDLAKAGYQVDVIDPAPLPLGRLLPPGAAQDLRDHLAAAGVRWHFQTTVQRIDRHDQGLHLRLADGEEMEADLVLSAIGLRPRTALAATAGLRVERGIVVDRLAASSAADVYALGDCAELAGLVLPFVMPIMHAARALAQTLAGRPTPVVYPAMPVVVKTPARPTVVCPPPAGVSGEWHEDIAADGVRGRYLDTHGQLRGFALTGAAIKDKQAYAKELPALLPAN